MTDSSSIDRTAIFDKVLQHLYDNSKDYWIVDSWIEQELKIDNHQLVESIVDELLKRGWATPKSTRKYVLQIAHPGQQIIEKYKSYSLFLESLSQSDQLSQSKKNKEKNIKHILSAISAGGILWGAFFTYLNYDKGQLVKEKDQTISRQQTTTDSLRQILDRQQKTIDSLSHQTDTTKTK